jgi:hypothetical protein
MATRFRKRRLRPVIFWILGILLLALLWKAFWRYGPALRAGSSGGPALFELQAQVLLKANLHYPRRVEAVLPAPERGTSAEAQLRLMELWDGKAWSGKATRKGRLEGKTLRVPAGRIDFSRITAISAERVEEGRTLCRIDYQLRWEWPDQDRELLRVAAIVGLKTPAPAGFGAPGQEAARFLILERKGLGWQPLESRPGRSESSGWDRRWSYLAWCF